MDNSKHGHIPMQERLDLNKTQGASTPKEVKRMQNVPYASAVDVFLVYGGNSKAELRVDCYCDAGFETDRDDTKSQTGYVFILNGGAVDWKSSKQSTIVMSATKAEYIAASEAAMEAVWIRKFISRLGIVLTINEPIRMFCDNSVALHFANKPGVQKGAKHYHRRYHYVRESIALGEIRFLKVHTYDNLADPFTKALSKGKLTQHARSMGLHGIQKYWGSKHKNPFRAAFRSMFEREKLSENNFNDWFRQLKLVLRVEKKMFVIEQPLLAAPAADSNAQVLSQWNVIYDAYNEVACLILGSMSPELHRQFENPPPMT
ncbi:hypothetical protein Tco_0427575 [Tanacetum coccineum]